MDLKYSEFTIKQQNIMNNSSLKGKFDKLNYKKEMNGLQDYILQTNNLETCQNEIIDIEEEEDLMDYIETENFDIIQFLNPMEGSKDWIKEQAEIFQILIEEKKFKECSNKLLSIKNLYEIIDDFNYDTYQELDDVFNSLIEKLCNCFHVKFIVFYLLFINFIIFYFFSLFLPLEN